MATAIPRFQRLYPQVELDITISDQAPDALEEGIDLAIRSGPLDESSMVARRICNMQRVICAAPGYLQRCGTPRTPDDLQQHNCLWITSLPALRRWPFDTDEGIRVVNVSGNVVANNAETVLQLVMAGVGITRLTDVIAGDALRSGALVPILSDWHHVEPVPLYATYPSGRNLSPKVRAMVDFWWKNLAEHLGGRVPYTMRVMPSSQRRLLTRFFETTEPTVTEGFHLSAVRPVLSLKACRLNDRNAAVAAGVIC